jgi:hypothetical protein
MTENEIMEPAAENIDYIAAINELKQNTVSKDQYNKVINENKQLLQTLMDGGQVEIAEETNKPSLTELANKIAGAKSMSNVEYIQTMCDYYDALVDAGYGDLAITVKHGGAYDEADKLAVERTINGLKEMLADADGDNNAFTALYQSVVRDVAVPRK